MNFNFSNILNLLEAKQGNFDIKLTEKKKTIDFSTVLNLSTVFSVILTELLSKSTNANFKGVQNDILKVPSLFNSNEVSAEVSQKEEPKEITAEIKNESAEFPTLVQRLSIKQGSLLTLPLGSVLGIDSIQVENKSGDYEKVPVEFISNAEEKATEHIIPKPEQKILSKDTVGVAKTVLKVGIEKIANSSVDLVEERGIFMHVLKGHRVVSSGIKGQNQRQEGKSLDKAVATFDLNDRSAQVVESEVSFHEPVNFEVKAKGELGVKINDSDFKAKEERTVLTDGMGEKEETQIVKFDKLIHKVSEKNAGAKDNLSAYNGKFELTSLSGKFEAFEDAGEGKVIVKEGVRVQDVVDVVKNSILTRESSRDVEVILKLEPKELGEVVVKISRGEKGFSILFEVKNIEVKHAIESSVNNLKLMLEASNVNLEKVGVVFGDLDLNPEGSRRDYGWKKFARRKEVDLSEPIRIYGGSIIEAII